VRPAGACWLRSANLALLRPGNLALASFGQILHWLRSVKSGGCRHRAGGQLVERFDLSPWVRSAKIAKEGPRTCAWPSALIGLASIAIMSCGGAHYPADAPADVVVEPAEFISCTRNVVKGNINMRSY
jgi:hypothetical protein